MLVLCKHYEFVDCMRTLRVCLQTLRVCWLYTNIMCLLITYMFALCRHYTCLLIVYKDYVLVDSKYHVCVECIQTWRVCWLYANIMCLLFFANCPCLLIICKHKVFVDCMGTLLHVGSMQILRICWSRANIVFVDCWQTLHVCWLYLK